MAERPFLDDRERIASLETQMADVRSDVKAILSAQDEIKDLLAKASGGLKVVLWLGGIAAGLAGFFNYLSNWLHPTGGSH
jgi:hypothetical protein